MKWYNKEISSRKTMIPGLPLGLAAFSLPVTSQVTNVMVLFLVLLQLTVL